MTNYILNLRVLNCENLIFNNQLANDCNIFIRCHIQNYENSYVDTKIVEHNANPQFNEELKFCVYNPDNDNLIIEVICKDTKQEINLCSPISFPLNKVKIGIMSIEKTSIPLYDNDNPGEDVNRTNISLEQY